MHHLTKKQLVALAACFLARDAEDEKELNGKGPAIDQP